MIEAEFNKDYDEDEGMTLEHIAIPSDYLEDNLININIDNSILKCELNKKKFQEGIDEVSKLCGSIVALYNVGINPHKAMDYLTDKEATLFISENNIQIAKITADSNKEAAKSQGIAIERQSI